MYESDLKREIIHYFDSCCDNDQESRLNSIKKLPVFEYSTGYCYLLLEIICDDNMKFYHKQMASIHLKNFILKNWKDESIIDSKVKFLLINNQPKSSSNRA